MVSVESGPPLIPPPGDTFYNLNPGSLRHLWVVVSRPAPTGEVVIFNFTTWHAGDDESCVIEPGDHPAVRHRTVIAYRRGRLLSEKTLAELKRISCYSAGVPVSPELLARIHRGALASPFTPQKLQALIQEQIDRDSLQ